jgi:hypothetical protein
MVDYTFYYLNISFSNNTLSPKQHSIGCCKLVMQSRYLRRLGAEPRTFSWSVLRGRRRMRACACRWSQHGIGVQYNYNIVKKGEIFTKRFERHVFKFPKWAGQVLQIRGSEHYFSHKSSSPVQILAITLLSSAASASGESTVILVFFFKQCF